MAVNRNSCRKTRGGRHRGVFYVTFATRYQMDVPMKNRLASNGSGGDADIKANNGSVFGNNSITEFTNKVIDGEQFVTHKIKAAVSVSPWHYQRMQWRHGMRPMNHAAFGIPLVLAIECHDIPFSQRRDSWGNVDVVGDEQGLA